MVFNKFCNAKTLTGNYVEKSDDIRRRNNIAVNAPLEVLLGRQLIRDY